MRYRNRKTGAIIETDCVISGDNWEPVEDKATKATKATKSKKKAKKEPEEATEPEEGTKTAETGGDE